MAGPPIPRATARLAEPAQSVLDIGCGTGLLAAYLSAQGKRVTGLDPAAAMPDIARARPGGTRVPWLQADARNAQLGETFDLVVMTGHAFQCFLTGEDRLALLHTVARHPGPTGRFLFDRRNPLCRECERWTPGATRHAIIHQALGPLATWNDVSFDPGQAIASCDTVYAPAKGPACRARSRIAFPPQTEIAAALANAGLLPQQWVGAWDLTPFCAHSPEIIAFGGRGW